MKMKKIGFLGLALVLALALTGAGFAIWSDTVDINGRIETGTVQIGIRDTGTSDPGNTLDPRREIKFGGDVVSADKHVATTTSTNGNAKCMHGSAQFFDSITYLYEDVYPGYAPTVTHEICNCGSIPVHLTFSAGGYSSSGPLGDSIPAYMDIVLWEVFDNNIGQANGTDAGSLDTFLTNYQLHPCHRLRISEEVHFYTNSLPQGAWIAWTITVTGTQWNA